MNREIKFRAWDKKDNVMREVYGIQFPKISNHGNRKNIIIEMHCTDYEKQIAIIYSDFTDSIDRVELMQYTGLKDKNGKEIYEGDIFDCPYGDETINHHKWEIIWGKEKGGFALKRIGESCNQDMVHQTVSDMVYREIIGNIYENPDLIK